MEPAGAVRHRRAKQGQSPRTGEFESTDGQVERPTERERRSQHVEVSVESPASPVAALRVALEQFLVTEAFEGFGFFSVVAVFGIVADDP
jgi:hypothetical protein